MSGESVFLNITTTQEPLGEEPSTMELQTEGTMLRHTDHTDFSYEETAVTEMDGVTTTFSVYADHIVMTRSGEKLKNTMEFYLGKPHDSLYDLGFGALLMTVTPKAMDIDLPHGAFEVEYAIDIERTPAGTNRYRVECRKM